MRTGLIRHVVGAGSIGVTAAEHLQGGVQVAGQEHVIVVEECQELSAGHVDAGAPSSGLTRRVPG